MDNITAPKKKIFGVSLSFILILFLVLFVLGVFGYIFYSFKDSFKTMLGRKDKETVSVGIQTAPESPFANFGEGNGSGSGEGLKLDDNMAHSFDFLFNNQTEGESIEPVIGDGEIVIEVAERNGEKYFKLLASKDDSFKYKVGDEVSFNPVILPQNLLVQVGDMTISYSFEIPNFKIPDSLKIGDKIVFICKNDNCKGNELDWGFIYTD